MPTVQPVAAERSTHAPKPILRETRAGIFAALCVLVGAVGHDAFSVGAIPLWTLVVGGAAIYLLARPLTRRECGLPLILALMAVVQVGLHYLFTAAQRGTPMSMPMALPPRGLLWCGHSEPGGVSQVLSNMADAPTPKHSMTAGMWAAHIVAALVAAWWLRRGEAAVWSLARTLGLALVAPLVLLVVALVPWTPPRRLVAHRHDIPVRLGAGRFLCFDLARRGPPRSVAAFA